MKAKSLIMASATLGLGVLIGGMSIAHAGGMGNYHGVPVPAPAPVPIMDSGFYVRIDGAYVGGDVSKYETEDPWGDASRTDSHLDDFARFGGGVGYRFNRWFRIDGTLGVRSDVESNGEASRTRTVPNTAGSSMVNVPPTPATIQLRDTVRDTFTSDNTTLMLNAYVDLPMHAKFTPYIGVGIGAVRHRVWGRSYSKSTTCIEVADCDPDTIDNQPASTVLDSAHNSVAGGYDYALAVAAMVGVSYQMWDGWHFDMGYRWLHLGGTRFTSRGVTGFGDGLAPTHLKIPDQSNHELRVGMRWEIK